MSAVLSILIFSFCKLDKLMDGKYLSQLWLIEIIIGENI